MNGQEKKNKELDYIPLMRYVIGSLRDNQRTRSLNRTIEGSYFLLLYRVEPKVSKIQIFSPNWANGSQLSLNRSE